MTTESIDNHQTVVHVITGLQSGGAERMLLDLSSYQVENGFEVHVVAMTTGGDFERAFSESRAVVHQLALRRRWPLPGLARYVRLVREIGPSVVHAHMFHAIVMTRLLRLLAPVPLLVSTIQNVDEGGNRRRPRFTRAVRGLVYRLTDRLADITTQVSRIGAEHYVRKSYVSQARMVYVPNASDTERFQFSRELREKKRRMLGLSTSDHLVVSVGSLTPQKCHHLLIEAFGRAFLQQGRARLVIAGEGPLRPELERQTHHAGLSHLVDLPGNVEDIVSLLCACDAFALASSFEGMPLAVIEAMACGCPVVATDVGAMSELIESERNGVLVPPGNVRAMGDALTRLAAQDPSTRTDLGANARRTVEERWSLEAVAGLWTDLYAAALRPRRFGAPVQRRAADS